jgi:hypothetical protein
MRWEIILLLVAAHTSGASEIDFRHSKSVGYSLSTPPQSADQALDIAPDFKQPRLVKEGELLNTTSHKKRTPKTLQYKSNRNSQRYSIARAWISLHTDTDFDGYYRRLDLSFDANVYSGSAYIYANIYLSFEGGPWNLLYTSNDFKITGNSMMDEYVVETELDSGYPAGYYDVLIELYDAYSNQFLIDYGPYDSSELSALPMEDRRSDLSENYNDGNYDAYAFYGSGSFGWISLLLLSGLFQSKRHLSERRTILANQ